VAGDKLGRYEIISLLGRGGMGQVYLARHEMQQTLHALKILPADSAQRKGFVERFQTELRTMARLQHRHIVHVTHSDEQHGRYYLVMDFIAADGTREPYDLEEALADHGRMDPGTTRRLVMQVCEGLAFAHQEQVVHRDLKPANILLTSRDLSKAEVRVGDFGLARVLGEEQVRTMVARSMQLSMSIGNADTFVEKRRAERSSAGAVLGTYGYMSPEQEEGRPADARSDIYSVGVLLYRMITGQRLRGRAKAASAMVQGLDPAWDRIIDKCLEPDPDDRWQSAEELGAALDEIRAGKKGKAAPRKSGNSAGRGKPVRALALVVMLAVLGAGAWWLVVGDGREAPRGMHGGQAGVPVDEHEFGEPADAGFGAAGVPDTAVEGVQARLVVRPGGAHVTIHNEERTVGMGTTGEDGVWSLALLPGKYDLIAQKDGYELLTLAFEMGDEPIEREWSLTPLRGMVSVKTVPGSVVKARRAGSGQEVELGVADGDGRLDNGRLVEGDYDLAVEHPDYHAYTERIEVRKDRISAVTADLAGRPGSLFIAASPQAEVWVDGVRAGVTGTLIEGLEPGGRRMEVRRSGYRTERFTLQVQPNREAPRRVLGDLARESGAVRVTAEVPEYARTHFAGVAKRVRVGSGEWQSANDLPFDMDGLACEEHEVRLEAEGYRVQEAIVRVNVADGETVAARFSLVPEPARVTVRSATSGAAVYDAAGNRLGAAGTAVEVPSLVAQQLVVRADRHQDKALDIRAGSLQPGGASSHEVALEEIRGPVAGENWTSPATGMEFVWVRQMNMWVGKHEVTNAEYRRKEPGHDSRSYQGRSLNGDRQPVVYVNFDDGKAYAEWLTARDRAAGRIPEGYRYRLPTGDEWMTFAQCGDGREYPWGNNWPPRSGQAGNYRDAAAQREVNLSSPISGYTDGHAVTAPVDELWANPWGLKGVGGNVWEATSKTAGGDFDAWRGASWRNYYQDYLRCTARYDFGGSVRDNDLGFRLVLAR